MNEISSKKPDDVSSITDTQYQDDHLLFDSSIMGDYHNDNSLGAAADGPVLKGRDSEQQLLLAAYQQVVETQNSQVVFVHGTSGQGKTWLVDKTLRELVFDSNGYFCTGKFFQDSNTQEPYSAVAAAFSDLGDLVAQSPDFEKGKSRIQKALGVDCHLLSRSVNMTPFFDDKARTAQIRNNIAPVSFPQFRVACKSFLLAMASEEHPVVLFLDDIQWMDGGSEKLIDMFIHDKDIKNVMFVFSYRDEEADAVKGIVQSFEEDARGDNVTDIQLTDLDLSCIRSILTSYFDGSSTFTSHE